MGKFELRIPSHFGNKLKWLLIHIDTFYWTFWIGLTKWNNEIEIWISYLIVIIIIIEYAIQIWFLFNHNDILLFVVHCENEVEFPENCTCHKWMIWNWTYHNSISIMRIYIKWNYSFDDHRSHTGTRLAYSGCV